MKYVEIKNGVVIAGPFSVSEIPDLSGTGIITIDVTNISPEPRERWTYENGVFSPYLTPISQIRAERNQWLKETDWRDLPSYPGSDQEAWREYRQALRDLPDGYVPVANPVFPEPPNS